MSLNPASVPAGLASQIHLRGGVRYDELRANWNGTVDQHPAVIVAAETADHVVTAMRLASETGHSVGVRASGHGAIVPADGQLLLDVSSMKAITVDPETRRVHVEPGVTAGRLVSAIGRFDLSCPTGGAASVGMTGYTLAGGFGRLTRLRGLAVDQLRAADVVLPDGSLVTASDDADSDLFWAIRGGGGNFGVVVGLEFELHPLAAMLNGYLTFEMRDAVHVIGIVRDWLAGAPRELTATIGMLSGHGGASRNLAAGPEQGAVYVALTYAGDPERGRRVLAPLRKALPEPVGDNVIPTRFGEIYGDASGSASELPAGWQNFWHSSYATELSDELIETVAERFERSDCLLSFVGFLHLANGAFGDAAEDSMAFSHRGSGWVMHGRALLDRVDLAAEAGRQVAEFADATSAFTTGEVPVTYLAYEGSERIRKAFSPGKWSRLTDLKSRCDPANVLCLNANIPPVDATLR